MVEHVVTSLKRTSNVIKTSRYDCTGQTSAGTVTIFETAHGCPRSGLCLRFSFNGKVKFGFRVRVVVMVRIWLALALKSASWLVLG